MTRATRGSARIATAASLKDVKDESVQLSIPPSSPPEMPRPTKSRKRKAVKEEEVSPEEAPAKPKSAKLVKKVKKEGDVNDLPHNLGAIPDLAPVKGDGALSAIKVKKVAKVKKATKAREKNIDDLEGKATTTNETSPKKKASYGLTPGQTPYPNYPHPTAEECEEVNRILSKVHGEVTMPKEIPLPSLEVSGCGEVPSVLDALIRTRLSAATSGTNSSRAFAGLVQRFGVVQSGIGKGSVDWNAVRKADVKEIFEAIKSGGLADVKSKDIKKILQMVWEENQARRDALKSTKTEAEGETNEAAEEKGREMQKADEDIVSLDHLHLLSNDDAFAHLTSYPGIGPKTASCVLLFCLQRPSFAVDTHVFRLCKWLDWVPPPGDERGLAPGAKGPFAGPTRNSTYAHCEVRVPDHLKYPLHQLLIKHGKNCPRCRAITGESSEGWDKGCPIDHLVQRSGGRKGDGGSPVKANSKAGNVKKTKKGKKVVESEDESEAEVSELSDAESSVLSDLVSDAEIEASNDEASTSE
ncbi:DNA glycosylase [Didymella exigua CBS 183.55]|uniref:DNA glycosylase n=1 Tax=Didymella exigua CBS 183.55 TaxID=1150837 RepID=A0A6A5RN17_9PLEO|nr:DNA glycosylase [Didymella exigua CBS 183.55]KAF1929162.1 DNA glycosylase [Didymella exigua CBS 183.55]